MVWFGLFLVLGKWCFGVCVFRGLFVGCAVISSEFVGLVGFFF